VSKTKRATYEQTFARNAEAEASPSIRARVLVVEDEMDLAWLEQFNLETEGYEVHVAPEGRAAIRALESFRPDVLVLDVMLPYVNGWSVLERMQELPAAERPKVVLVSALTGEAERARAVEFGARTFLPKPFEMDHLLELVAQALASS
jgi:DNA-binding response OmpR family regulator